MNELRKLIERDTLRRDLLHGIDLDDGGDEDGIWYDVLSANDLMRRAAEEIDAMQEEINILRAVEAKEATP